MSIIMYILSLIVLSFGIYMIVRKFIKRQPFRSNLRVVIFIYFYLLFIYITQLPLFEVIYGAIFL